MSLPTQTILKTMDFSFLGSPFVSVCSKAAIVLSGMDYSSEGSPFVSNDEPALTGWKHKINGIANINIGKINGVLKSNISKVNGI